MANGHGSDRRMGAEGSRSTASARRRARRARILRRRRTAVGAVATAAFAGGLLAGAGAGDDPTGAGDRGATTGAELPRGGRSIFPEYRLVGFYGAPQDEALGALGVGTPAQASRRLLEQAAAYERDRPVLPVLELLAAIAAAHPGDDGLYVTRQPHSVIRRYLAEARRRRALLLLDIQPGRGSFAAQVDRLGRYLREPDVGLALDPEWHVGPDEVPGQVIGSVNARTVNEISARLAAIVARHDLPEKLFVIHQFTEDMIRGRSRLRDRTGLATVLNSDGFGDPANKIAKYDELRPRRASPFHPGFKLFYSEDTDLMSPEDVLALEPAPELIVYE